MRQVTSGLLLAAILPACAGFDEEEEDTRLHVQGTVTAAGTGQPLGTAVVELAIVDLASTGVVASADVDAEGRYEIVYVEEGYCPESLLSLSAMAPGHETLDYLGLAGDSIHVRCTEDTQTIDFALEATP